MFRTLFCTLLRPTAMLSFVASLGFGQPATPVSVPARVSGTSLIVPVKVNGAGPYDFVLDTGSNTTLIEDSLFEELGMQPEGAVLLVGVKGENARPQAFAR